MSRRAFSRLPALGVVLVVMGGMAAAGMAAAGEDPVHGPGRPLVVLPEGAGDAEAILEQTLVANSVLRHTAELMVVSLGRGGPRIGQLTVAFDDEGARVSRGPGTAVGRVDGRGFLRSSAALLQMGGVQPPLEQVDRLLGKYVAVPAEPVGIDTGTAAPVILRERETNALREVLYVDEATGLLVRRETYDRDGNPTRVVAYTRLEVADRPEDAEAREVTAGDGASGVALDLRAQAPPGFVVPDTLPLGYELLAVAHVPDAPVPTLHLIYGDGVYIMSVFQQRGRLDPSAIAESEELRTPDGGMVWTEPGAEPRRLVWSGGDITFTLFADASTDELLDAIVGLPADPPPGTIDRLQRGLTRVTRWIVPNDRSET